MNRFTITCADECFLTGTAAECVPVTKLDGYQLGSGKIGPVTARILARFQELAQTREHPVKISQPFFGPTKTAPSSGGAVFLRYSVKYKKENTGKHIPAELYSNLLWKCRLATFTASRSETLQKNPI